jgi:hypothetical protein
MSVRQNIPRHRPDGGHGPPGRTTVRTDFLKFPRTNLSCLRTSSGRVAHRPDGRTSAASNFLIRLSSVRTMGDGRPDGYSSTRNFHISNARVRTMMAVVQTVEVESAISFFDARVSGPRLSDVRTVIFELRFLPY